MSTTNSLPSAFSLFKPSFQAVLDNVAPFFVFYVIPALLTTAASFFTPQPSIEANTVRFADLFAPLGYSLPGIVLTILFYPPLVYTILHASKGERVNTLEAFRRSYPLILKFIGLGIVVGLLIILGFLLFIIPGIIMMRRYYLAPYYLLDRKLSIGEAMKQSAAESKQYSGAVYGVIGVVILIGFLSVFGIVGVVASSIGALLYSAAPGFRYWQIKRAVNA